MNLLFTLRVRVAPYDWTTKNSTPSMVVVRAFETPYTYSASGHTRIDVEVRHNGRIVFPVGATWCAVPAGCTTDGIRAKELVLATIAMRPGDTDSEYFASYTPEQLAFSERYGEELSCERERRYCDENGNVRK